MKRFCLSLLFAILLGSLIGMSAQVVKTEMYVRVWESRVQSLDEMERQQHELAVSQEYGARAVEAVRMLAVENGLLCERDAKAQKYVLAMEEENAKLKAALNESVDKMVELLEENSNLHQEIINLSYKVRCLEQALEAASKPPEPTVDSIKNDILDILSSYFQKGPNV
jgi:small-conductance mechanosensitive channel